MTQKKFEPELQRHLKSRRIESNVKSSVLDVNIKVVNVILVRNFFDFGIFVCVLFEFVQMKLKSIFEQKSTRKFLIKKATSFWLLIVYFLFPAFSPLKCYHH